MFLYISINLSHTTSNASSSLNIFISSSLYLQLYLFMQTNSIIKDTYISISNFKYYLYLLNNII
nr:MAG TPA: hypothetical protein [Caudoviricetes sp.]